MSFYSRYEERCNEKKIKPSAQSTAELIGCAKTNISILKKNGKRPNGDIIANAAVMLNVSADYLLELIDDPRPINAPTLSAIERELLSAFHELNEEGKEASLAMLRGLSTQEIYKKYPEDELDQKDA